jgi:hypothetical protein
MTSVIHDLQTFQKRVDFATSSFKPEDGVRAKEEAIKTLEPYLFRSLFRKETYDFLIRAFGSEKELKKNTVYFTTTGKSGNQLKNELQRAESGIVKVNMFNNVELMLQSSEFQSSKADERIIALRLSVRTLFSNKNDHTYAEILARAKELGLDFLPHETAADLLLDKETQPKLNEEYRIFSKPISDRGGRPRVFFLGRHSIGPWLNYNRADLSGNWCLDNELMFRLSKSDD